MRCKECNNAITCLRQCCFLWLENCTGNHCSGLRGHNSDLTILPEVLSVSVFLSRGAIRAAVLPLLHEEKNFSFLQLLHLYNTCNQHPKILIIEF